MGGKIKLIKILKNQILYSLPSVKLLGDKFIDEVDWPADKATLVFKFPEKEAGSGKPVADMVSRKKYVCRLSYMVNKRMIPKCEAAGALCGLSLAPFKNLAEHRKWAMATDRKYFFKPFKNYLTPSFQAEAKEYYKTGLPKARGISVRKKGKIVSMLTLLNIFGKDAARPLDWVAWIWADPALPKEERRLAHSLLRGWLRKNSSKYVGASVHAANLKSQNWFLKSGFRPARIAFTRRAAAGKQARGQIKG